MCVAGGLDKNFKVARLHGKGLAVAGQLPGKPAGNYAHLIGPNQTLSDDDALRSAAWGVPPSRQPPPPR